MTTLIPFSLLMAVYKNDSPVFLVEALESVLANSRQPDQVVIVEDGPITKDLEHVLQQYSTKLPLDIVSLPVNQGLGPALRAGVLACKEKWIARFDSDDICEPTRFEQQLNYVAQHPTIDMIGGQIAEFETKPDQSYASRRVPLDQTAILAFAKSRNPMNHMTVMFRKSAVIDAGNYQSDPLYEDYGLWIRMLMDHCSVINLPSILVYARAGAGMFKRRGGSRYARNEIRFQYRFYKKGFLSLGQLIKNIVIRVPVRLMPNQLRAAVYKRLLRE